MADQYQREMPRPIGPNDIALQSGDRSIRQGDIERQGFADQSRQLHEIGPAGGKRFQQRLLLRADATGEQDNRKDKAAQSTKRHQQSANIGDGCHVALRLSSRRCRPGAP